MAWKKTKERTQMYALKYSNTINVLFLIAMKLRRLNKKKMVWSCS